jgi:DNA-directed RNA polymerase specialized sigma24 family protein
VVLRLHREEGVTLREVGQRMGRSYEAAKKLHGRAMVEFIKNFEGLRRNGHD